MTDELLIKTMQTTLYEMLLTMMWAMQAIMWAEAHHQHP